MKVPDVQHDPWTRVRTANGFAADELVSALQKSIRRGLTENAALVAYEMFLSSEELENHVWRRLQIISVEDVGLGRPDAPLLIDTLNRFRLGFGRDVGERAMFLIHAVRLLADSPKDRTSDEMTTWIREATAAGEARPEVFDLALDMHTRRGQELGRGFQHWFGQGALVENEIPNRDLTYRERVQAILDREGHTT